MKVYSHPFLYQLAFSYRNIEAETKLLTRWFHRASKGGSLKRVLELGAGPADHAVCFARQGFRVCAVDKSSAMCSFALSQANAKKAPVDVRCANMISFNLGKRFDLALAMLDSLSHLHDLDEMVSHLTAVARHLRRGGVYIVEMAHPASILHGSQRTKSSWTISAQNLELKINWGHINDSFNPITQITNTSIRIEYAYNGRRKVLTDKMPLRVWTMTEFQAAVKLSSAFQIVEQHGSFNINAPFDNLRHSWRMISVLRRR